MGELIVSIIAVCLSAIAITVSIGCYFGTKKQTEKINRINIKSRYFEKIFDDYLIDKIPKARTYIRFTDDGHLSDVQQLIDTLSDMRTKAAFFKFDNKDFYEKLKRVTQDLEDYLSNSCNKSFDQEEQADVYKEISKRTMKVYSCISDYYLGL